MLHGLRILLRHRATTTVGLVFAVNGLLFGSWFTRIPGVQSQLGLSEGELGLALLGVPLGSLLSMPAAGWLASRFGAGRVTFWASLAFCAAALGPVLAGNVWLLALALALLGASNGLMDIAMNAEAAAQEERLKLHIMATFHALYSIGGAVGAVLGGLAAGLGLAAPLHLGALALAGAAVVVGRRASLLDGPRGSAAGPAFAVPSRALLPLAVMAFCVLMGEGAIGDWSAVYLRNTLEAGALLAGAGFAGFSLAMTVGRLYGDVWVQRYGARAMVCGGALLAALGLGLGLLLAQPWAAVLGFTCVGLGYAGLVPILFRAAARAPGMAPGVSLAAVASVGYAGFLCGPPVIGLLAEAMGLGAALGILVGLSLLVAALGYRAPLTVPVESARAADPGAV